VICALSAALLLQTGTPVLLRVKPQKGVEYDYDLAFSINAKADTMSAQIPMREKYTGMKGGDQLWEVKFLNATATGRGNFASFAKSVKEDFSNMTMIYERKPTNVPVAVTYEKYRLPVDPDAEGTSDLIFPVKPVLVGNTWIGKFKAGASLLDMTYKYLGTGTHKGLATWRIEGTPKGAGVKTLKPYLWQVDQRDGRTLDASGQVQITIGDITAQMTFSIQQTRRGPRK